MFVDSHLKQIKKKNCCFKYEKKKHTTKKFNVFYQHKKSIIQKKIEILLSKMNIEHNQIDFVYFYDFDETIKYIDNNKNNN